MNSTKKKQQPAITMRLFQNSGLMRAYVPRLHELTRNVSSFVDQRQTFLNDRFGAPHFLKPVLEGADDAFFTNGDDERLQRAWAKEQNMKMDTPLEDILLAQIEAHCTEVFYNNDPVRYPSSFISKLPGCVKHKIAWRAAPSGKVDFSAYDLIVCNFPSIIESYRKIGWHSAYFTPAHDPEMDAYAANEDRLIDILFVGGYSRHHRNRAIILESVARLKDKYRIVYHIDRSRFTKLAETPLGVIGPLKSHRRPAPIRAVSSPPVFGRDFYTALSNTKIVLNGAIDMAGPDRGNMRCFEAMGCGALLLSDEGNYPNDMTAGETMITYSSAEGETVRSLEALLSEPDRMKNIATAGNSMIREHYSKQRQWERFIELL